MNHINKRIDQKFDKFVNKNIDQVSEYESLDGVMSFDSCKYDIIDKIQTLCKLNKECEFNNVLKQALRLSIQYKQNILDSLTTLTSQYLHEGGGINITQAYFKEIGEIYKKNKNNYDIEYKDENRDKLIQMNLKTVVSIAKRYQGLGLSLNELISAGNLGLCVAWDKFDPSKAKLKDNLLEAIIALPDNFDYSELMRIIEPFLTYGDIKAKLENKFKPGHTYTLQELRKWIDKNVYNAKFSSIAVMWIKAFILIEIDNHSRVVKKPKTEIYKDKEKTGSYQKEQLLDLDKPLTNETDTTFADTLDMEDETSTDMEVTEAYDIYKDGLNKLLEGVPVRDRIVVLKKFGIGLPRPLLPREIADQEGLSIARISQIFQITMDKMRKNCVKYNIDPTPLFNACRKFR